MPRELRNDPASGVAVAGGSISFSLASTHWKNAAPDYTYSTGKWERGEFSTMNMAKWAGQNEWYSAQLRLDVALGFGQYEQSIKVGVGSGITTAFYLCEYDEAQKQTKPQSQEVDFEFSGHTTDKVQTNVWRPDHNPPSQYPAVSPLWTGDRPSPPPDCTAGWGQNVYRYKLDWEPDTVAWSVDRTGSGDHYMEIRKQDMAAIGRYNESLCYPYLSFWCGWAFDNSPFLKGIDAPAQAGESGPCYQAFFFEPLKFTPSANNTLITLIP